MKVILKKPYLITTKLVSKLKQEIYSFDRYFSGQLKIINHIGFEGRDVQVKDIMGYGQWLITYKKFPVIKVEGLENFIPYCDTVHLFHNQKSGFSFKWHHDEVDVVLSTLEGKKTIYLKNQKIQLQKHRSLFIRRGTVHKVFSTKNTLALSFGFYK